jgi:hypothetical protein
MALDIPDGAVAGIVAFYAIVNIPRESLPLVFRETRPRVTRSDFARTGRRSSCGLVVRA